MLATSLLRRYNLVVAALGAAVLVLCGALWLRGPAYGREYLAIQALFVFPMVMRGVEVRRGRNIVSYNFITYFALLGVDIGPWYLAPFAALVSRLPLALLHLGRRRPDRHQLLFHGGAMVLSVAVGLFVASLAPPYTYVVGALVGVALWDWLSFGNALLDGEVCSFAEWMSGATARFSIPVLVALVVSVLVSIPDPTLLLLLAPLSVLLLYWAARGIFLYAEDRDMWRAMEEASKTLVGVMSEAVAVTHALRAALVLFRAHRVVIELPARDGAGGYRYSLAVGDARAAAERLDDLALTEEGLGVLRWRRVPHAQRALLEVAEALQGSAPAFGIIRVQWKRVSRRNERARILSTFASTVAQSVAGSRAYTVTVNEALDRERELQLDQLTGLGNRTMLFEQAPAMLAEAEQVGRMCALLLLDLDGFKKINDTLGHTAGDAVLKEVGARISAVVRRDDLAVRLGGDEFAVLLTDLTFIPDAELVAAKINVALAREIKVDDLHLSVEASTGIAIHGQDAADIAGLYKRADIAMYQAKAVGSGRTLRYSAANDANDAEALALATELRRALEDDGLVCHYQPQVSLLDGSLVGVEALVRWNHPRLGLLPPHRFVPLAEHSGIIRQFTLRIAAMALRDLARLRTIVPEATVSVNLSIRNLLDTGLPADLHLALSGHGIEPRRLVVEVTETVAPADHSSVERILDRISGLGIQVSLDDFGTGFSSLDGLRRPAVSEAKIDRDFVRRMNDSHADRAVVRAIITMAHAYRRRVVAEGIEDVRQLRELMSLGCDVGQGYFLAEPMPVDELLEWAARHASTPVAWLRASGRD